MRYILELMPIMNIMLELLNRIFNIYLDDINVETGARLERELPVFRWGRYLNKFTDGANGN